MRIDDVGKAHKASAAKKTKKTTGADFGDYVSISTTSESASGASQTPQVMEVSSLMALQAVDEESQGKSYLIKQGYQLLDQLDVIKMAILQGQVPLHDLEALESTLTQVKTQQHDPKLDQIINEITLRARVEIAKLRRQ